jgi:hypothetical protein
VGLSSNKKSANLNNNDQVLSILGVRQTKAGDVRQYMCSQHLVCSYFECGAGDETRKTGDEVGVEILNNSKHHLKQTQIHTLKLSCRHKHCDEC